MFKKNVEQENVVQKEVKKEVTKAEKKKGPTQRQVVFQRVVELVKDKKLSVKDNQPVMEVLDSELLKVIYERVLSDFKSGRAALKKTTGNQEKLKDDAKLRVYVVGLCSNWLRRDPLLNGDEKFKV